MGTGTGMRDRRWARTAAALALSFAPSAWAQFNGEAFSSGIAPVTTSTAGGDATGVARSASFLPGVRLSQYYTDNIHGQAAGRAEDGFTTEVSPYLRASLMGRQAQGSLDLMIRNFYRTEHPAGEDSFDTLRYSLSASGQITDEDGRLGVSAAALVRDINPSPFGTTTVDPSLSQTNRRRYSSVTLAPYLRGRFSDVANYRAEYRIIGNHVEGSSGLVPQADHRLNGSISSLPGPTPWAWSASTIAQRREFQGGYSFKRSATTANLYRNVSPELQIGALVAYEQVDNLRDSSGDDSGLGSGVSVRWTPSLRTSLEGQWARQYYGPTSSLNFTHNALHWSFRANYFSGISTTAMASPLYYNPAVPYPGGIDPSSPGMPGSTSSLLSDPSGPIPAGLVVDVASRIKRFMGSVGYSMPRTTLLLTYFKLHRETAVDNPALGPILNTYGRDVRQQGIFLSATRQTSVTSSAALSGGINQSESAISNDRTRLSWLQAGYTTRLAPDATAGFGVRRSVQSGRGTVAGYDSNTVFGTLDLQF